jgi:hypothetical protein
MERIAVSYQQLVTEPVTVVTHLFCELTKRGVKGLVMPTDSQIFDFVDPNLNRSRKDVTERIVTEEQQRLFDCLGNKTALAWSCEQIPKFSKESFESLKNSV